MVDLGDNRVQVGLILRKAILVNSLLFTAEAWSGVREANLVRLEQVDLALLRSLVSGHSKCATEFAHLETGTLKLRHILTQNRLMYHHHILQQDKTETIRQIYEKQKTDYTKGDWFQLLIKDFEFIEETMDEEQIKNPAYGRQRISRPMRIVGPAQWGRVGENAPDGAHRQTDRLTWRL